MLLSQTLGGTLSASNNAGQWMGRRESWITNVKHVYVGQKPAMKRAKCGPCRRVRVRTV